MSNEPIGGFGILVSRGYQPYISQTGITRWNGANQRLEVMGNGNDWHTLDDSHPTISLSDDVMSSVLWVQKKIAEEDKISELCEKHVGLKDLKEKYEIMLALVQDDEKSSNK